MLRELSDGDSGWIVARGGEAWIAYYPLAPFEWRDEPGGDRRLHSPHLKNGAVIQVAPAAAFDSAEAFRAAVEALPLDIATEPSLHVRFTTLRGSALNVAYGETPNVDGVPVDYERWPLFDGPFLRAERGSRRLEIRCGDLGRTLDFERLTVHDTPYA